MPQKSEEERNPIDKGEPVTPSEKYLDRLCLGTFLSLWSYPAIYRDQRAVGTNGDGKEVCDHLVVFGNDVIIFSDKHCQFPKGPDLVVSWKRWFRRAIESSAEQALGAERWIRQFPNRLFIDRLCTKKFPIELPACDKMQFHLVVVAHGISEIARESLGGSGGMAVNAAIKGLLNHEKPFQIGDLDPEKTFVHVLDDDSLELLLTQRDTISDFVSYLGKRASFLRGSPVVAAPGERQLLALYMVGLDEKNQHDFILPPGADTEPFVQVPDWLWTHFQSQPERIAQLKQDQVSYLWDDLIEKCNKHVLEDTQYFRPEGGLKDSETILRFMAKEPRFMRRFLSRTLLEMVQITPKDKRRLRVWKPDYPGQPHYVFLLFPHPPSISEKVYREVRQKYLHASCMVAKLGNPDATHIIGFATESDPDNVERSEDFCFLDATEWPEKLQQEARKLQKEFQILVNPIVIAGRISEFPKPPN